MQKIQMLPLSLTIEARRAVGSYSTFKPAHLVSHRIHISLLYSKVQKYVSPTSPAHH